MLLFSLLASSAVLHGQTNPIYPLQRVDVAGINQGWGEPHRNQSVEGHPIKIGGDSFPAGVGTHADSELELELYGNALTFSSMVGVDDETEGKGSVRFLIFVDGKRVADSGVMKGGDKPKQLTVDLKGARRMRLVVRDGNDGNDYDHADWANAIFTLVTADKPPKVLVVAKEPTMAIAHVDLKKVQIHGPRVVGATPGRPFLWRIPATGEGLTYSATGLPSGVSLDAKRGVIAGSLASEGSTKVTISIEGPKGKDSREITIKGGNHMLAQTPPMGWNSWNVWATSVDANKVRAAADSFNKVGLASFGYTFINIDDGWEAKSRGGDGEIIPNEKFPDMPSLTQYVHNTGLKLGIYSSPGPETCGGYLGSYKHELQDAQSYASWGIDYLKYDWCSYGGIEPRPDMAGMQKPYVLMRDCLDKVDRDIVFSLCQYGMGDVFNWGKEIGGNLWRTTGDINDSWRSLDSIAFSHSPKAAGASPGGWNDPDMLVVGKLGWGPSVRPTKLSGNEQITHISMWALLGAPLIIGCDLTQIDEFTTNVLMNHDVIEVDQDSLGKVATRRSQEGDLEVWARPLWDGSFAVGLVNRGPQKAKVTAHWKDLDASLDKAKVRDLWKMKDVGSHKDGYTTEVPAHGTVLIKVWK